MNITIEQLASLIDGGELREIDLGFDDELRERFFDALDHLRIETAICDEADEIYEVVQQQAKVEYLREFFAEEVAA